MDEAEYLFMQTARERKRDGRGDFHKKRRGGRGVRLPSDNLTAKQRKELNGKVMTYDLNKPVTWREFKAWPTEHKAAYIRNIESKTGAGNAEIGEMMGVGGLTISNYRKVWGCPGVKGKHTKLDRAAWEAFLNGESRELDTKEERETEPEAEPEKEPQKAEIKAGKVDAANIAAMLQVLLGVGAKITIELSL